MTTVGTLRVPGKAAGEPVPPLVLAAAEVAVWTASLDLPRDRQARLATLLSDDECARAGRFRFERDRARYVAGRGTLRLLLSAYTGVAAAQLRFRYGEFGKPALSDGGPSFNLSHSGGLAIYAFRREGEIGVDVELECADYARERIPERFFSPREVADLRSLAPELQPRAFLNCWTRKEAFIKARGDGLSLALDSFDVTLAPGQPAALLRTAWSAREPVRWQLHDLSDSTPSAVAALALRSERPLAVTFHRLSNPDGTTWPLERR